MSCFKTILIDKTIFPFPPGTQIEDVHALGYDYFGSFNAAEDVIQREFHPFFIAQQKQSSVFYTDQ